MNLFYENKSEEKEIKDFLKKEVTKSHIKNVLSTGALVGTAVTGGTGLYNMYKGGSFVGDEPGSYDSLKSGLRSGVGSAALTGLFNIGNVRNQRKEIDSLKFKKKKS